MAKLPWKEILLLALGLAFAILLPWHLHTLNMETQSLQAKVQTLQEEVERLQEQIAFLTYEQKKEKPVQEFHFKGDIPVSIFKPENYQTRLIEAHIIHTEQTLTYEITIQAYNEKGQPLIAPCFPA